MPSAASPGRNFATLILCIPEDLEDGYNLYTPLPKDHFAVKYAFNVMSDIADAIEHVVGPKEPYEINLLGLNQSSPVVLQPVLTIGIARSDRLKGVLPYLQIPYVVHLSSHYPASSSNNADRNPRPKQYAGLQQDLPSIGSSCGLLADDRHSVTMGSYVRLSSAPKRVYILTAPLSISPSMLVTKGNVVTQPSVADRECLDAAEDNYWKEVLMQDADQAAAVAARRESLQKTFEFGRTVTSTSRLKELPGTTFSSNNTLFDEVWDGTQKLRPKTQVLACASESWTIVEVTRTTTHGALTPKKRWLFHEDDRAYLRVETLLPGLVVSKTGRTTGRTVGTVNGVKSLYRLPRDGGHARRYDYAVVSSFGEPFSLPGDAGAMVLAQQPEDVDANTVKNAGNPCGLIIGSSTSGHVSFIQDMESIVTGVKNAGLGDVTFIDLPL